MEYVGGLLSDTVKYWCHFAERLVLHFTFCVLLSIVSFY